MKQSKDIIIGITIGVIVLAAIIGVLRITSGGSSAAGADKGHNLAQTNPGPKGALFAEESSFDFGTISMSAGKVNHLFKIKNTGADDAVINKMYTSCMCTEASIIINDPSINSGQAPSINSGQVRKIGPFGMPGHGFLPDINLAMKPGEEADVEAVFDPAAHGPAGIGKVERTVRIENSSGQPLDLNFTATVTP